MDTAPGEKDGAQTHLERREVGGGDLAVQQVNIDVLRDGQVAGAQRLEQAALAAAVGAEEAVPPAGRGRGGGWALPGDDLLAGCGKLCSTGR